MKSILKNKFSVWNKTVLPLPFFRIEFWLLKVLGPIFKESHYLWVINYDLSYLNITFVICYGAPIAGHLDIWFVHSLFGSTRSERSLIHVITIIYTVLIHWETITVGIPRITTMLNNLWLSVIIIAKTNIFSFFWNMINFCSIRSSLNSRRMEIQSTITFNHAWTVIKNTLIL